VPGVRAPAVECGGEITPPLFRRNADLCHVPVLLRESILRNKEETEKKEQNE
jgi:hypothetical protein